MTYFLDTNTVTAVLNNRPERVRQRLRHAIAKGSSIATSPIVLFELWYGVACSQRPKENAERLRAFFSGDVDVAPFDESDAAIAGDLRATLKKSGKPIGPYDVLIAAQALRMGATLVTANVTEFARIHGLAWQDWSAAR